MPTNGTNDHQHATAEVLAATMFAASTSAGSNFLLGGRGRKEFEPRRVSGRGGVVDHADVPIYLRIADKAKHLRELVMSDRAIARTLDVR